VDPESTKDLNFGLIDGGAVHFVHHRIWLPTWKHHEQRKKKQHTPDLAGEIWYYPPGMTPNYGIEPTPSTTATPSMYIYSGASPPPSPAGNAAGEGSGLARPAEADSQSGGRGELFERERKEQLKRNTSAPSLVKQRVGPPMVVQEQER
jgi:hypothetical protein